MRRYRFRVLVSFDSVAREDCAPGSPSRAGVLTKYACCLVQPFYYGEYFPAVISGDQDRPAPQRGGHAVVTVALAGGEAEAFFAPGQGFTVWADGVAGRTIQAEGMVGYGVICGPDSGAVTFGEGGRHGGRPARRPAELIRSLPGTGACGCGS